MQHNILRIGDVKRVTGLGGTSIYALVSAGKLPAPVRLTRKAVGWLESDVQAYLQACIAASRGGAQ